MSDVVLFDLDGTLIDSRPAIVETYRYALEPVPGGLAALDAMGVGRMMKLRMTEIMAEVAGDRADECAARYDEYYRGTAMHQVHPYPGAQAMLAELRRLGVPLGIVTNKGRTRTGADLDGLDGLGTGSALFDVVVTTEDTPERKPSPQPLLLGLDRGGWDAPGAVYVGDGPHDAQAARGAGMAFVGAGWGYYPVEVAAVELGPVAADLPELLTVLTGLLGRG